MNEALQYYEEMAPALLPFYVNRKAKHDFWRDFGAINAYLDKDVNGTHTQAFLEALEEEVARLREKMKKKKVKKKVQH